jgi:hypothetical protein
VRTLTALLILVCGLAGYGLTGSPAANAQGLAAVPAPSAVVEPGGTATIAVRVLALGPGGTLPGAGTTLAGTAAPTVRAALYYGLDWGYADSDPQQVLAAVWYAQTGAWPDTGDHAVAARILSAAQANPNPSWLSQGTSLLLAQQNNRVQIAAGPLTATGLNGRMGTGTLQVTSLSSTRQSLYLPYGVLLSDGTNQALAWAVSVETGPAPAATATEPAAATATATEPAAATATATGAPPTTTDPSPAPTRSRKPPLDTPTATPSAEPPTAVPPTRTPKPPPYTPTATVTVAPPTETPVAIAHPPTVAVAKPPTQAAPAPGAGAPPESGPNNRPADAGPDLPAARPASGPPTVPPAHVAADRHAAGILPPPQATGAPSAVPTGNPGPIATAPPTRLAAASPTPSTSPSPRPTATAAIPRTLPTVTAAVAPTLPPLPTRGGPPVVMPPSPTPSTTVGARPGIEPPVKPTEPPPSEPTAATEELPTPIVLNPGPPEPPPVAGGGTAGGATGQPPQQQPTTGHGSSPVFPALFLVGTLALTLGIVLRRATRAAVRS